MIACISRNGVEFRSEEACLFRAEERGREEREAVGKRKIVEAGSGSAQARAQVQLDGIP